MIWLRFAFDNLLLAPLASIVNVLLMALGTASIVLLLVAGTQLSDTLTRDARGIDLVIGASGSPAQLILSTVYHADIPPGNISLAEASQWANDARVAVAAPLALGDSYRGFRIAGTTRSYPALLNGSLAQGTYWSAPLQAVLGASVARKTGLVIGSTFNGAHGLSAASHDHDEDGYRVVGILADSGTVLDRLILTSLDSVWRLHGQDVTHDHVIEQDHERDHNGSPFSSTNLEVTALLLKYETPLAAMSMPGEVNSVAGFQAAAPAVEISRILQLIGLGLDGLRAFAWVLIVTACLSVFAALYGSLRHRRRDLAMLRCLGATRTELFLTLMSEGLLLSLCGVLLGFLLGHLTMTIVSAWLEASRGVTLAAWQWVSSETSLLGVLFCVSVVSAILPAWQAYRTDVARTLAEATS